MRLSHACDPKDLVDCVGHASCCLSHAGGIPARAQAALLQEGASGESLRGAAAGIVQRSTMKLLEVGLDEQQVCNLAPPGELSVMLLVPAVLHLCSPRKAGHETLPSSVQYKHWHAGMDPAAPTLCQLHPSEHG